VAMDCVIELCITEDMNRSSCLIPGTVLTWLQCTEGG